MSDNHTPECPEKQKRCTRCGVVQPIEDFPKNPKMSDGYLHQCKSCVRKTQSEYREQNRESRNAQKRLHYYAHRTEIRTKQNAYYKEHREEINQRARELRATKPEYYRAKHREDYLKHEEKRRQAIKDYAKRNHEETLERASRWKKNNPDKVRAYKHRRRAQKRATSGSFTKDDLVSLLNQQKGLCWWCGCQLESNYHVDHRVPLSKGGTNQLNNIVLACPECNLSKNAKMPGEWNGRLL